MKFPSRVLLFQAVLALSGLASAQEIALNRNACMVWSGSQLETVECRRPHGSGLELRQFSPGSPSYWLSATEGESCLRNDDPMSFAECLRKAEVSWGLKDGIDGGLSIFSWTRPTSCLGWDKDRAEFTLDDCDGAGAQWYDAP